jgi:hypothetical protein
MAHRVAGDVEVDLDEIWIYVATESSSVDIANRVVDSIADRFFFSPVSLTPDGLAIMISASGHAVSR